MGLYDNKRVVVTGGTSGIGLAAAKFLLEGGARVMVTGSSETGLAAARNALGPEAVVVRSDAASLSEIDRLAEEVRSTFGALDALLVCAGRTHFAPFEATPEEVYDTLFDTNAKGAYFTAQRLAPMMTENSGIVFVTSVANVLGIPMISAYSATKAAVRSMTRTLARELLPRRIRVNAVSPGPIDSGILEKAMPPEAAARTKAQMSEENPMRRFGRPDEVARAMAFLAFEASYTTGAELAVDGGGSQL